MKLGSPIKNLAKKWRTYTQGVDFPSDFICVRSGGTCTIPIYTQMQGDRKSEVRKLYFLKNQGEPPFCVQQKLNYSRLRNRGERKRDRERVEKGFFSFPFLDNRETELIGEREKMIDADKDNGQEFRLWCFRT